MSRGTQNVATVKIGKDVLVFDSAEYFASKPDLQEDIERFWRHAIVVKKYRYEGKVILDLRLESGRMIRRVYLSGIRFPNRSYRNEA